MPLPTSTSRSTNVKMRWTKIERQTSGAPILLQGGYHDVFREAGLRGILLFWHDFDPNRAILGKTLLLRCETESLRKAPRAET